MNGIPDQLQQLLKSGLYSEALAVCVALLRKHGPDPRLLAVKIWLLGIPDPSVCDTTAALALFREAVALYPADVDIRLAGAQALESGAGDYAGAAQEYRSILALQPANTKAAVALSMLIDAPGSRVTLAEVRLALTSASAASDASYEVERELALLDWREGDRSGAQRRFETLLRRGRVADERERELIRSLLSAVQQGRPFRLGAEI